MVSLGLMRALVTSGSILKCRFAIDYYRIQVSGGVSGRERRRRIFYKYSQRPHTSFTIKTAKGNIYHTDFAAKEVFAGIEKINAKLHKYPFRMQFQ